MSIESVMPSNHFTLCCPLLLLHSIFPSIRAFSSKSALCIRWPKYWSSASTSVLLMNIQDWFPLGLTGLIFLLSRGLSRAFPSTTSSKASILSLFGPTLTSVHDYWNNYSLDYTDLCQKVMSLLFNTLSRFVTAFLPKSKCLLISWLQSLATVLRCFSPNN